MYLAPVFRAKQAGMNDGFDFGLPLQGSCANSLLILQPKSLVVLFISGALFPWHTTVGKYWLY